METISLSNFFLNLSTKNQSSGKSTVLFIWETLLEMVRRDLNTITIRGVFDNVEMLRKELKSIDMKIVPCYISIDAACDLFKRFIGLTASSSHNRNRNLGETILDSGNKALEQLRKAREKISKNASKIVKDGSTILLHGHSRCVLSSVANLKSGTIYMTKSSGEVEQKTIEKISSELNFSANVVIKLIPDTAMAFYMQKVDFCLVGAEGVIENGGIVNQIGTYQLAIVAKSFNKPFYCASESYKFMRMYPLSQDELRNPEDDSGPLVDMTPPELITLFFTDIGVMTPGAVCDELMKLYE